MKKYRKKPVVIEAFELTKEVIEEIKYPCNGKISYLNNFAAIDTLEGEMIAILGDYIIRGIKGEFYPCKPDIFKATYEEVKE